MKWNKRNTAVCFFAIFGMGFFVSFLILCGLGTDPCTFMNRAISSVIGLSFGTWQLLLNIALLAVVILCKKREVFRLIGLGTVFNMVLIGYYADFFDWLWGRVIPAAVFTDPVSRWPVFLLALAGFIVCAAFYMNAELGLAPYDAVPAILQEKVAERFPKFPKTLVRICWDWLAILIGILMGAVPNIGVMLMAVFLGPVVTLVGRLFNKRKASCTTP